MTRFPRLAPAVALAVVTATADAQGPPPPPAADSAADSLAAVGRLDGRAAAAKRDVTTQFALGFTTGFLGGAIGLPLLVGEPILGVAAVAPMVWALDVSGRRQADLPLPLARVIERYPPAYQKAYWAGYTQRVTQRRRSAGRAGAFTGALAGLGTLAWFISQINFGG